MATAMAVAVIEVVKPFIDHLVANPEQLGLGVALLASALYYKKFLGVASGGQAIIGRLVFAAVALGALLLSGVVPYLNVDLAVQYGQDAIAIAGELWTAIADAAGV